MIMANELNSFTFELLRTISVNCPNISPLDCLAFIILLSFRRLSFQSLVNDKINKKIPSAICSIHAIKRNIMKSTAVCQITTMKYPNEFFQSKGHLKFY